MTALVKVGLPSHLAEGARVAKRVQQILDQRAAAFARIEADFSQRLKSLVAEESAASEDAADSSSDAAVVEHTASA